MVTLPMPLDKVNFGNILIPHPSLQLPKPEPMGVFTTNGYEPGVSEEKLEEIRHFGTDLK